MAFHKLLFQENGSNSTIGSSNLYGLLGMAVRDTGFYSLSPYFLLTVSNTVQHDAERATAPSPRHPPPIQSLQQNATCSLYTWLSQRIYF